jgi:hypothetical protein
MRTLPLSGWPTTRTRIPVRSNFSADWIDTTTLLSRELAMVRAAEGTFHLDIDTDRGNVGRDGWPLASAKPKTPGVILAFVHAKAGRLEYAVDRFLHWQDNIRAIALGLEALRKLDRYGITHAAEQYVGFKQLPNPNASNGAMSLDQAVRFIADQADMDEDWIRLVPNGAEDAIRKAMKRRHPDAGGTVDAFQRVQEAARIVRAHHGSR